MPLIKGKSPESFKHNLKAEMHAGKKMNQSLAIAYAMKRKAKKMAEGGMAYPEDAFVREEEESGYMAGDDAEEKRQVMAEGGMSYHPSMAKMHEEDEGVNHDLHEFHTPYAHGGDIVDHIMRKRYSEGGKVANGGEDELDHMADGRPNNFDDLSLRDDLSSSYGDDDNSGDALGNDREDEDRHDIVARIMRQRSMRQHNPRPA